MNNYSLIQNRHIMFGAGEYKKVGELVKEYADTCLIVHDGGAYLDQLLSDVKESLSNANVEYWECSGVKANPVLSKAKEGIATVEKNEIGFILAIGGGSVMDTAKYIAVAVKSPYDPLSINLRTKIKHEVIPHGTIVTLSGTSSELSNCCMIVDDIRPEGNKKYALMNDAFCYDFAIVDPELTYTLPLKQLAAGVMDTIAHSLEVYLGCQNEPLCEGYYESIIKTALEYGPLAMRNPRNYKVRSTLATAAMMAYNACLANSGVVEDWGCHRIETPITGTYNGTHGITLGILMPSYLKIVYLQNPRMIVKFAVNCMGVDPEGKDEITIVDEGCMKFKEWLNEMHLPTHFSEIGITYEMIELFAENVQPAGAVFQLNSKEIKEIYRNAV